MALEADEVLSQADLAPGQSATFTAQVRVPGGTEGEWRWQVKANSQGEVFEGLNQDNNTKQATTDTQLQVPILAIGTATNTTFAAVSVPSWFKVEQPSGLEVIVRLDAATVDGRCRLYAGYGRMPTEFAFDLRSMA